MTQEEAATHWHKRAHSELDAAQILFDQNKEELYPEVTFHCHLAMELALKAMYIQEHDGPAPFTHNLAELAHNLTTQWTEDDYTDFDQLSDNAVLARYGDATWLKEHATRNNAERWLRKVENFLTRKQS